MKDKNREFLIEIKGKIEGIAYCVDGGVADALIDVGELLDAILEDEKKGETVLSEAEFNTLLSCAGNVQNSVAVPHQIERVYHPEGVENS